MMKKRTWKYLCMVVSTMLVLGLAACGSKDGGDQAADDSQGGYEEDQPTNDTGVAGPGMEEPGDTGMEDSGADVDQGDDGFYEDEFSGWSEEMTSIREAVVAELGDDYWPTMEMPADYLEMTYNVAPDMYEDYMGEMPMMSAHVDTLLIVKAKEGQADAVEEALKAYQQKVLANSGQYPMNVAKTQACKVERMGNYVCFVLLGGDITEYEPDGDDAIIAHCQEQNDKVIQIISDKIEQ